jgi:signal transduction histidine kinase
MFPNDVKFTVIIVTMLILLLIAGVIITVIMSNKRHVEQEVKMAQMLTDYEKELRVAEQEVQEHVLVNVGRELHDNIGQRLTYINMQLEQQKFLYPEVKGALTPLSETLNDTITELRRMAKSLNSDLLETNGLIRTIDMEVARLRQLHYNVEWVYGAEPVLSKDQKVIAFRIFQETLNNIMKHAQAKTIGILLSDTSNFKLTVSDDGRGFDVAEKMQSSAGAGLKNMVKRAELAKMRCDIQSNNSGSIFILEQTA